MLQPNDSQISNGNTPTAPQVLQLLLFVDDRPNSQEIIHQIQVYLKSNQGDFLSELQIIEIKEQPHLVEHFRLVATPALVKIAPGPRHVLAGSNLLEQLKKWWGRWLKAIGEQQTKEMSNGNSKSDGVASVEYSAELIRLSDEVFRFKKEKEELQAQLKFKDQVLALLAHDLRSPLTAASIALETLELVQAQPENDRTRQLKEQLYQQAKNQFRIMNRLITDLLEASRHNQSEFTVNHTCLYLQPLCEEVLEQFCKRFQDKAQILEVDLPQDLPPVYADPELIRQAIINLLDNAAKYTPEGGKISVSVIHRTNQKVQLSVCDTGPGIPEAQQDSIFEARVRLERDKAKDGYGLGLSLCRKVIRAHHGHLWVDSVLGEGSCFNFTLPVCP
ncbi:histidine kinase [Aphanothece hegewaldii CCALA 016]|uniref:Adaptive-response sensory-kinase SasA n=1 Tax=Aphanothece hegewaldii CCALA 016 TaxID=2107694 RepID=A0A2T1LTX5_9CHRO|nr:histidine kinase [Aphanothece hegewaldii]PSF34561.1 histidine kinase [Aphanothece hegewaldii CCALA 016]